MASPTQRRPPRPRGHVRRHATCRLCGISSGNSLGVQVHRYNLQRGLWDPSAKTTRSVNFGGLVLCARCLHDNVIPPSPEAIAIRVRLSTALHLHQHRHPETHELDVHDHGRYLAGHRHGAGGPSQPTGAT